MGVAMRTILEKSDTHPVTTSTERPELEALLGWFFSVDDGRCTRPYFDELSARELHALAGPHACEEQVHRRVRRRLLRISNHDAGVLQAALAPRAWPKRLRKELGRLTGIVVRLASARDWPEETSEQDLLEVRVATQLDVVLAHGGGASLDPCVTSAAGLLRRALGAYRAAAGAGRP
jgi:hypothetical protein